MRVSKWIVELNEIQRDVLIQILDHYDYCENAKVDDDYKKHIEISNEIYEQIKE